MTREEITSEQQALELLIQQGETLEVEFKSDQTCLPDRDLIAAIVALANTEGGTLLLGVEDDGQITGLHSKHKNVTSLSAFIANKTNPALTVKVNAVDIDGTGIAQISVPKSAQLVSTSEGLVQRRRLRIDGTPEAVPFYPHEFAQRASSLGLHDPSAQPIEGIPLTAIDPLQRVRIRNTIKKYGGDQTLLPLSDDELDGALGITTGASGNKRITLTGLLILGTPDLLRQYVPAYEVAFQVMQGTNVLVNEFFRKPLLETFDEVEILFRARVTEDEMQDGLFRVSIPNYDRQAFREAFVNALVHRDYASLGAVHVKIDDDGLSISNPGGFIDGVSLENLLVASPRSRNPLLADAMKRIGLAERTGRGIDRIYEGMLRYGRPSPDYSMSNQHTVSVYMANTEPDFEFIKVLLAHQPHAEKGELPIDSLIILSLLRTERRLGIKDIRQSIQKPEAAARKSLEVMVESGLVEAHGTSRGRTYTLSSKLYRKSGQKAAYIRQAGFESIQQEEMVMRYIKEHGSIKRADIMELCHLNGDQAYRLVKLLIKKGKVMKIGEKKASFYQLKH